MLGQDDFGISCATENFRENTVKVRFFSTMLATVAVSASLVLPLAKAAALEKETWLGLPVEAASQEYTWHSGVALELSKVKVQTTTPMTADKVWLTPDWADWLTKFRTSHVRASTGEIVARPSSLVRLGRMDGPSSRIVTRLEFTGLKLLFGTSQLALPGGEMRFSKNGELSVIRVVADKMTIELTPHPDGKLGVLVQTGNFKWPLLPAFEFDDVAAQGEISDDVITLDKIGASGPDGAISAALRLVAAGQFQLEGTARMEGMHAESVIERLYRRGVVTGLLTGDFKFSAQGDSLDSLPQSLQVEGDYKVANGVLDKFGLLEGMRRREAGVVGGGQIRFDSINGKFKGAAGQPAQVDFQGLKSGALHGSSNFVVTPDGKLNGAALGFLQLPGGESVSRTFQLSGTVSAPVLTTR